MSFVDILQIVFYIKNVFTYGFLLSPIRLQMIEGGKLPWDVDGVDGVVEVIGHVVIVTVVVDVVDTVVVVGHVLVVP